MLKWNMKITKINLIISIYIYINLLIQKGVPRCKLPDVQSGIGSTCRPLTNNELLVSRKIGFWPEVQAMLLPTIFHSMVATKINGIPPATHRTEHFQLPSHVFQPRELLAHTFLHQTQLPSDGPCDVNIRGLIRHNSRQIDVPFWTVGGTTNSWCPVRNDFDEGRVANENDRTTFLR